MGRKWKIDSKMTTLAILNIRTDDSPEVNIERFANLIYHTIQTDKPDIVIGPEYLFYDDPHKPFSSEDKASLVRLLESLTTDSNTILFPGSIIWTSNERFKNVYQNTTPVIHEGRTVKEVKRLCIRDADKGFVFGNNCSAFNQRPQDFGSEIEEWLKVYTQDRTIEVNGAKYLLEICDDHHFASDYDLNYDPQELRDLLGLGDEDLDLEDPHLFEGPRSIVEVDFQIIISNGHYHHFRTAREKLFLKERGILIESNGRNPSSFVGKIVGDKIKPLYVSEPSPPEVKIIYI